MMIVVTSFEKLSMVTFVNLPEVATIGEYSLKLY
jgi:hypothetical protein